ncbi:MAG: sugar transferase [Eubacteriales bacterium]|nr:sugar transferase [Eubacteriales bacterium]
MYKRFEADWLKHLDFLLLDMLALQLAFVFSYCLRFGVASPYVSNFYQKISALLMIIHCCVAFFDESYHGILKRGCLKEAKACIKHVSLIFGLMLLYLNMTRQSLTLSRGFFLYLVIFSLIFLWSIRCGQKNLIRNRQKSQPDKQHKLLVLASSENVVDVLENLKNSNCLVAGICLVDQQQAGNIIEGVPVVADIDTILDYVRKNVVDGLFVELPRKFPLPDKIMDTCISMGVSVHIGLLRPDYNTNEQLIEKIGGYTVLTRSVRIATVRQLFLKRLIDICAGLAGIVVIGICFLFVAPAIYMASPGPIFFTQTRVGKNGRKFKIYKFRSMYMGAEECKKKLMAQNKIADGMMFKMDDDPRIIKGIGHFIRNYSIDELPQLWNVLKGEMSLIGTRPPTVEEYEKYDYHHKIRLSIKPGITGMWQVSGRSSITDFEQVVALDTSYITNWTLGLDFKILLKTVKVVLGKEGAV